MLIYVIAICELVAFLIALCVIAQQRDIIKRQGRRLLEALDWIEKQGNIQGYIKRLIRKDMEQAEGQEE